MQRIRTAISAMAGLVLATGAYAADTVIGATHYTTSITGGSTVTIVSPSANTNGVKVQTAVLSTSGIGVAYLETLNDGNVLFIVGNLSAGAAGNLPYPLYLPPGVGLAAAANIASTVWVTYDNP